jgi:hypothetical protein
MSYDEYENDDLTEISNSIAYLATTCQDKNNAILFFKASHYLKNQAFEIYELKETIEELLCTISTKNLQNKQKK